MTDLEKISQIVKESFGVPLNQVEKEGLLSSEKVLVMLFDNTGEIQFTIVEGVQSAIESEEYIYHLHQDWQKDCDSCRCEEGCPHADECPYAW